MIIAVVGLEREARIVQGPGIVISRRGASLSDLLAQGAEGVISTGIAAGVDPSLKVGDCVVASQVIVGNHVFETDERWRQALCSCFAPRDFLHVGPVVGCDGVVASADEKARLRAQTSALAADMESQIAAAAAVEAKVPFAALRVISDEADEGLPPAAAVAMRADGSVDMAAVVGSLIKRPTQIPALMRTARNAEIAFKALLRCRSALGARLAFPDLG